MSELIDIAIEYKIDASVLDTLINMLSLFPNHFGKRFQSNLMKRYLSTSIFLGSTFDLTSTID